LNAIQVERFFRKRRNKLNMFDFVEKKHIISHKKTRSTSLPAFGNTTKSNVASTLLLVWTGLKQDENEIENSRRNASH